MAFTTPFSRGHEAGRDGWVTVTVDRRTEVFSNGTRRCFTSHFGAGSLASGVVLFS